LQQAPQSRSRGQGSSPCVEPLFEYQGSARIDPGMVRTDLSRPMRFALPLRCVSLLASPSRLHLSTHTGRYAGFSPYMKILPFCCTRMLDRSTPLPRSGFSLSPGSVSGTMVFFLHFTFGSCRFLLRMILPRTDVDPSVVRLNPSGEGSARETASHIRPGPSPLSGPPVPQTGHVVVLFS